MSMISELEAEASAKREKEIVAWAMKCGKVDGVQEAIELLELEAGKLYAQAEVHDDEMKARLVRDMAKKLKEARMKMMRDIPPTPQPNPELPGEV